MAGGYRWLGARGRGQYRTRKKLGTHTRWGREYGESLSSRYFGWGRVISSSSAVAMGVKGDRPNRLNFVSSSACVGMHFGGAKKAVIQPRFFWMKPRSGRFCRMDSSLRVPRGVPSATQPPSSNGRKQPKQQIPQERSESSWQSLTRNRHGNVGGEGAEQGLKNDHSPARTRQNSKGIVFFFFFFRRIGTSETIRLDAAKLGGFFSTLREAQRWRPVGHAFTINLHSSSPRIETRSAIN